LFTPFLLFPIISLWSASDHAGGKALTGPIADKVPAEYGAVEPTAVRIPIESLESDENFALAVTELFGPFQVLVDWKEVRTWHAR
jgi:1-pyrroline-5-carboxylate dehydrogenase